ncbi:GGDEF domain-containing protein [Evansella tamaricis]|uniref:GGDEF domain-containing protein n=1 Tax=Evansella tamaricis TaxID=2069301 RepID=A0ABS6JJN0_9BACI|nr:diguanylate cyclase [Evansella tamaricis]MBU9713875.1 GGDEF domain-containing protein [Evansella tamaricis]
MKMVKLFPSQQVSVEKQQLLEKYLFDDNIQRCKLFASIVILFEAVFIVMHSFSKGSFFPVDFYLAMYLSLLFLSLIVLIYIRLFEIKSDPSEQFQIAVQRGLHVFVIVFLVWGAVITLADQSHYGHIMAFAINFMCVSILYHATNRTIIKIYIIPVAVLLIGLPFYQPSSSVLMGHYINLSVFLFFCWLASRLLYRSIARNFFSELLLKESNENLALKIAENEKMNVKLTEVNQQLKRISLTDELTNVLNRRGMYESLEKVLRESEEKRPITMMMIDIDAFKQYNDHYGHLQGDEVIQLVARKVSSFISSENTIFARFGGEEFVLVTLNMNQERAGTLAEAIRQEVASMKILHEYSPVSEYVSISIGIAIKEVNEQSNVESLMELADQALYKAKSKGRNRIELTVDNT